MPAPIRTNKIKYQLDKNKFVQIYDLFAIKTTKNHFKTGAYILDAPALCDNVASTYFYSGRCLYVLMNKDVNNKANLKAAVSVSDDFEYITIAECHITDMPDYILLQLLMNSLGNYSSEYLKSSNLTGHMYCYNPSWIIKKKSDDTELIKQVVCLELKITADLVLRYDIRTFTSTKFKNKIKFTKKKYEEYPKFILNQTKNFTLSRRVPSDDEKDCFIMRQFDGRKSDKPFFDIYNYENCKLSVIARIINLFNDKYQALANIDFESIEDYSSFSYSSQLEHKELENRLSSLLQTNIRLIDCIDDSYSKEFCKSFSSILKEKYGVKVVIGKRQSKDALNLKLIHSADYYDGVNDPHNIDVNSYAIQHITFENFVGKAEQLAKAVIDELLIKNDLRTSKITTYDWSDLNFSDTISFGISYEDESVERFIFMDVYPDGNFNISEQENDLFGNCKYNELIDLFDSAENEDKHIEGVIKYKDSIAYIYDSGMSTLPELFKIDCEINKGNTSIRGKEMKEELFSSIMDVKTFFYEDKQYYFVGSIGKNLKWKINNSNHIRCLELYKGNLNLSNIAPLMDTTVVHNGQLTVIPFPFKYLREYINTNL